PAPRAAALEVPSENRRRHGLEARVELIESDLFDALGGRHYDLIVSNPPYVDATEIETLPEGHRHEPRVGLAAGYDGLEAVRGILAQAATHLAPDGLLIVE